MEGFDYLLSSGWFWFGAGLLILIVILIGLYSRSRYIYEARESLFSIAEQRFLQSLEKAVAAVDEDVLVFGKVRLADIVQVRQGLSERRFWQAFTPIACKHVDYVLCERDSYEILGVIELDDRSHESRDRQERDEFVDQVLAAADIPVLHVPARARYPLTELKEHVHDLLH